MQPVTYRLATAHKVTDLIRDDIIWCELRRLLGLLLIEFQLSSDVRVVDSCLVV